MDIPAEAASLDPDPDRIARRLERLCNEGKLLTLHPSACGN
jgi:hypothetical protein